MGRVSAVFIVFCMLLIAAAASIVSWLAVGFTGMEATVLGVAVMTALVLINTVTGRQRDRYDMGGQIADLSRATGDIGRQVSELDRRLVAMEGEVAAAMCRQAKGDAAIHIQQVDLQIASARAFAIGGKS